MVFIVRYERDRQVGYFRFKYLVLTVSTSISQFLVSLLIIQKHFSFDLTNPFSNYTFVCWIFADKNFIAPNLNFINEPNLTRILKSEIFLHIDGQLCAAYVILGYKPISSSFQSPKYVIKAKDPRLQQINIVVPGFLASPLLEGTHQVELPTQCITEEKATSSHLAPKEETVRVIEVLNSEEDFEVFDQPFLTESPRATFSHLPSTQVSSSQEPSNILEAMVL